MTDSDLIDKLGGPLKVAQLLNLPRSGAARVCNWRKRGIPARIKLQRPDLFLQQELTLVPPASGVQDPQAEPVQRAA